MSPLEIVLVLLAGLGAGTINAIVGSGTLITFPTLVAFGVPPVTATMSNAVGLIPGNIASSFGYREELRGQGRKILQLLPASLLGSVVGAFLLLSLPENAFETIVPVLIVLAIILVVGQPALQRYLRERKAARGEGRPASEQSGGAGSADAQPAAVGPDDHGGAVTASGSHPAGGPPLSTGRFIAVLAAVFFTAVYGGYFAAAQGIILIALLGLLVPESLQRINGAKNVLVLVVNSVAAAVYIAIGFDRINWQAVLLIAIGSLIGGYLGARVGRRLNPVLLRSVIVVLSLVALWRILQM
ncbi:sulfite exporter TauE/SafE family protein [Brevibacterium daeguense]|uniref:Probable membrane transporter protein n=1 Tax=Brevibacterium daeguense TaxID=909936 RepID=A0ABP8ENB9_9MICO|nr:sulfite exporter TauE/SafE family protein [Brevibacterium daeguense]